MALLKKPLPRQTVSAPALLHPSPAGPATFPQGWPQSPPPPSPVLPEALGLTLARTGDIYVTNTCWRTTLLHHLQSKRIWTSYFTSKLVFIFQNVTDLL